MTLSRILIFNTDYLSYIIYTYFRRTLDVMSLLYPKSSILITIHRFLQLLNRVENLRAFAGCLSTSAFKAVKVLAEKPGLPSECHTLLLPTFVCFCQLNAYLIEIIFHYHVRVSNIGCSSFGLLLTVIPSPTP